MAKRTLLKWLYDLIFIMIGFAIIAVGVSLYLLSSLGSEPFTAFIEGISKTIGISIGVIHMTVNLSVVVLMWFIARRHVNIGTILSATVVGPLMNFFIAVLRPIVNPSSPLPIRILTLMIGCVVMSIGIALYMTPKIGVGPIDLISVVAAEKGKYQFRTVRISVDTVFTVLGILLGGVVGIGTIIGVLVTGPVVQMLFPLADKIHKTFDPDRK